MQIDDFNVHSACIIIYIAKEQEWISMGICPPVEVKPLERQLLWGITQKVVYQMIRGTNIQGRGLGNLPHQIQYCSWALPDIFLSQGP